MKNQEKYNDGNDKSVKTKHKVIARTLLQGNTAVFLEGRGSDLSNDIMTNDGRYRLISVGMISGNKDSTAVLVEGFFDEDEIYT